MKNRKLATLYYLFGYVVAMIGGFAAYYALSETVMWIFTMTFMPVLFVFLCYRYFLDSHSINGKFVDNELVQLTILWIALSFILDAVIYIFITPLILGFPLNWTFFRDHSPLIWLNYASIPLITSIGKWIYRRKTAEKQIS